MIGLVAAIVTGLTLNSWVQALGVLPYLALRLKKGVYTVLAFYIYILAVILTSGSTDIYSINGAVTAILLASTVFLILDDVLRGQFFEKTELPIAALLAVSAVNPKVLAVAMVIASIIIARKRFGKKARYLYLWTIGITIILYLSRATLQAPSAQALVIAGLALVFPMLTELGERSISGMKR